MRGRSDGTIRSAKLMKNCALELIRVKLSVECAWLIV